MTKLETFVPIDLLLKMFHTGVMSLTQSESSERNEEVQEDVKEPDVNVTHEDDDVPNLKCFIMMLDVLLKQVSCTYALTVWLKITRIRIINEHVFLVSCCSGTNTDAV